MKIERIISEVEFRNIECFEYFEYQGDMYIRLPKRLCIIQKYIGDGLTEEAKADFNAVGINGRAYKDYVNLKDSTMVRRLDVILKVYQ